MSSLRVSYSYDKPTPIETEGAFSEQASLPEGRLLIAVIERCFLDACIHRRALLAWRAGRKHTGQMPRPKGPNIVAHHSRCLAECDYWMLGDEGYYPVSLKWACEWLAAGDPDPLMSAFRRAYVKVREQAVMTPCKRRRGVVGGLSWEGH